MASEPAYLKRLKDYARFDVTNVDEYTDVERELWGENDRAFAVLQATHLENTLNRLFDFKLKSDLNSEVRKRIYGTGGALSTFSAKIVMAYAMGFIGPTVQSDLDLIRAIRNAFAHARRPMKFDIKEVKDVCARLKFPDMKGIRFPLGPMPRFPKAEDTDLTNARTRYRVACHSISYGIFMMTVKNRPTGIPLPPDPFLI
jgi:hypothetical protein